MRNLLKLLALFVVLALIGFFAARQWHSMHDAGETLPIRADCDLGNTPCSADLPAGGRVQLALTPRPIPLMRPIAVVVQVKGSALVPVRLDITGLNMDMGLNRAQLRQQGDGSWRGEITLPICSHRRMHWQADLLLADQSRKYHLRFDFRTAR